LKLWNERVDLDSSDFLITKDRNYTFHEIFTDSDRIFSETSREIVLILCDKNIETIKSYIGALRNNLVPLLIESETKQDSLLNILLAYKPKYVVSPLDIEIEKFYKTSDQYSTLTVTQCMNSKKNLKTFILIWVYFFLPPDQPETLNQ